MQDRYYCWYITTLVVEIQRLWCVWLVIEISTRAAIFGTLMDFSSKSLAEEISLPGPCRQTGCLEHGWITVSILSDSRSHLSWIGLHGLLIYLQGLMIMIRCADCARISQILDWGENHTIQNLLHHLDQGQPYLLKRVNGLRLFV